MSGTVRGIKNVVLALIVILGLGFLAVKDVQAKKVTWTATGASVFGGHCERSEYIGYRGDILQYYDSKKGRWVQNKWKSFAELGMGSAMGGLPHNAEVRVLYPPTGRKITIRKRDIGLGGGGIGGLPRAIDLYHPVAARIAKAGCNWTGKVLWRRLR